MTALRCRRASFGLLWPQLPISLFYRACQALWLRIRLRTVRGEGGERLTGDAHDAPFGLHDGTDGVVEVDGGGVPVEDGPLEARAALCDGDGGDGGKQGLANS